MYPTIPDLIKDLFGLDLHFLRFINTFGFFVALSFLAGAYTLTLELKRKEKEGLLAPFKEKILKGKAASVTELVLNGITGFIIGFKLLFIVLDYDSFIADPQGTILSIKGNIIGGLLGAGIAAYLKYRESNKQKLDKPVWEEVDMHPYQLVGNIAIVAAVSGIIGAKVFHFLEYPEDIKTLFEDPMGAIVSGLTFYGGLIMGTIAVLWYTKKKGIPILHMLDTSAPGLMLAYGVGRIGCQMAGDGDWGIVNTAAKPGWMGFLPDWMWAFNYPHNVINQGVPIPNCEESYCYALANPVFPTPFYETVMALVIFGILWSLRKKILIPGILFCVYLILNGLERFFIEKIRINAVYNLFGMNITQAEIVSTILVVLGIVGIVYLKKKGKS